MSNLEKATFLEGDAKEQLQGLPAESAQTAVTSPPYWALRNYGQEGQIGLEQEVDVYIERLCGVLDEVHRVLADDGTLWLNIGDSYAGSGKGPTGGDVGGEQHYLEESVSNLVPEGTKPKDLVGIPWRVATELRERGWYLRSDIIWHKRDPMPESVKDRPASSHEHIFLFSKSSKYYYDHEAAKGRDVWTVNTASLSEAHFAVYPVGLVEPCVLAGSKEGEVVLDPFSGAGTTGIAALKNDREYVGIDINPEYNDLARKRIREHDQVPTNHSWW